MTKTAFIAAFRAELESKGYEWAKDPARVALFMSRVRETLDGPHILVTLDKSAPSAVAAWRAIGGKGAPTYKALRALPA